MCNLSYIQFPLDLSKQIFKTVRDKVHASIHENKLWAWSNAPVDLRVLCFSRHIDSPIIRKFEIVCPANKSICGLGAFIKESQKDDFLEYLFLVLSDRSTIEIWTYNNNPALTYLAYNGSVVFNINSTWKSFFFNIFKWREKWDVFCNNDLLGFVDGKGVIRWNSLKMSRPQANSIPIHLSYPERQITEVVLAPLRLICDDTSKNHSDYVIPDGTSLKDDEVLLGFMLNIVFREIFYNMSYPFFSN
jgi:hypothetical protein